MFTLFPPFIVLLGEKECPKCKESCTAVALGGLSIAEEQEDGTFGEVVVSQDDLAVAADIEELPSDLIEEIEQKTSRKIVAAGSAIVNRCPHCEFSLFHAYECSEPGSLFWPEDETEASRLSLYQSQYAEPIYVMGISFGSSELFLTNTKHLNILDRIS